jgi:hypothetical protein
VFADPPAFDEPPEPVDGLPAHAASKARAATAMTAAAVRAASGHTRRGRHMTLVLSFIMASSMGWIVGWIAATPGGAAALQS